MAQASPLKHKPDFNHGVSLQLKKLYHQTLILKFCERSAYAAGSVHEALNQAMPRDTCIL